MSSIMMLAKMEADRRTEKQFKESLSFPFLRTE